MQIVVRVAILVGQNDGDQKKRVSSPVITPAEGH